MSERPPLIAGNWKMSKTTAEAVELALAVGRAAPAGVEVLVAPPFTALAAVAEALRGFPVRLGAQNCYPAKEGAFTGEVSPWMLADLGVSHVILGHSERRHILGEADEFIRAKVQAVQETGLIPLLCVGETRAEREADQTEAVIDRQLSMGLSGLRFASGADLVVAYEPVWAIGTGLTATPAQAQEVQGRIRRWLENRFDKALANQVRILYGGSVKGGNIKALMAEPDIDGALVGGASLSLAQFGPIMSFRS